MDGPVKQRYIHLSRAREPYLAKARKCAELTIPSLVPPEGSQNPAEGSQNPAEFKTPYQSVGARGVNNLGAKIMMVLFPPNGAFFRLTVDHFDLKKILQAATAEAAMAQGVNPEQAAQVLLEEEQKVNRELERSLSAIERAAMRQFELMGNRPADAEAIKHLIVAGSVLRYCPPDSRTKPRIFTLAHHVVKRDPDGTPLEMITKEGVSPLSVAEDVRDACGIPLDDDAASRVYDLYTHIRRDRDKRGEFWAVKQELNGVDVPGSEGEYDIDDCPWIPLRWNPVYGEDYGRGHVEEYLGDLISLEGLCEALLDGALAASRTLVLTDPNGVTKLKDVAQAENGAVIPGRAEDVTFLRSDKYHDLRTPAEQIQTLTQNLGHAFLLFSSVQRDAERVTREEIRVMAQELETALGGVYTTLGQEYQKPLVRTLLNSMQRQGTLPELPAAVEPVILTGMEAMGRNSEYQRHVEWLNALKLLDPNEVNMRLDHRGNINRLSASLGVNTEGLLLPEEVVEARKQQMQKMQEMQAVMQNLGPDAIRAGADLMKAQQAPQQ